MTPPGDPIDSISAWLVELPMTETFRSAQSAIARRQILLIKATAGGHDGWGEAAPVPGHTEENIEAMWQRLCGLLNAHGPDAGIEQGGMLTAAFNQATDDRSARSSDRPLWQHIGGGRTVAASAAIGVGSDGQPDPSQITSAAAAGYRHMKLKVTPVTSADRVALVTSEHPDVGFGIDANTTLGRTERTLLDAFDDLGLSYIEQPGPAADLQFHAMLRRELTTPVVLDEGASTSGDIERIVATGAADAINIKAGRFGTTAALWLARRVVAGGLQVRVGGLVESGIGRAHSVALASHPLFSMVGDLAGSDRYFANDLTATDWSIAEGSLPLPAGPGIGVEIDEAAITAHAIDSLRVG